MTYLTSPVAGNPGEFAITGANDDTGWIAYDDVVEDIGFNITGTWVGTIALQASNQADRIKTRYSTVVSYTSNQEPLNLPQEVGRFFRFVFTSYTSGTAYIGICKARLTSGAVFDLIAQGSRTGGS